MSPDISPPDLEPSSPPCGGIDPSDAALAEFGWAILRGVFDPNDVGVMQAALANAFDEAYQDEAVRRRGTDVYAARNVLDVCPAATSFWRTEVLQSLLFRVLGPECGLVRGLYFDKPPDQTWALPWHKDMMIAVSDSQVPAGYSRPRRRGGVWHTEPPVGVLQGMLTLRIHLDPAKEENGALQVLSGSHRTDKGPAVEFQAEMITAAPGDVLAMRPLLSHASGRSSPETRHHRRVLHLEFATAESLPGGVRWQRFLRVG